MQIKSNINLFAIYYHTYIYNKSISTYINNNNMVKVIVFFNQINHNQQLATNWLQHKLNLIPTKTETKTETEMKRNTKKFNVKSSKGISNINLSIAKVGCV